MNLLIDGIEQRFVEKTSLTRKITIDGITKAYPVWKVRIDKLFYNDQNDRIATWISQYKYENDGKMVDSSNREEYNSIIEKFIIESNPDAIKKTQNNIELVDQREPGVVLTDGRIIDGNRRFTCLRRLASKNDRFKYFEAVILEHNYENSAKQIKMLELAIQHGEESKIGYAPIDRLVGIYNDIIDTKLLTEEEYSKSTTEPLSEIKKKVELANLMVEFLEFINAPKQFHIARELQIFSSLEELQKLINKCHSEDEKEDLKICVFNNILMLSSGDIAKFIRNFKNIIGSEYQETFLEEQRELAEKSLEKILPDAKVDTSYIRDVIRDEAIAEEIQRSTEKALTKVKKDETRSRPIQLAEKATILLNEIDVNIIAKMNDSEILRLKKQLEKLDKTIKEIEEKL